MADTGFVLTGQGRAVNRTGGTTAWTNPGNITSDNGTNATVTVGGFSPTDSHWLVADTFDFSSIPAGAIINGIEFRVQMSVNTAASSTIVEVNIGKSDGTQGTPKSPATAITTTPTNYDYGGASDLWGLSISLAEVQTSTFQARVAVRCGAAFTTRSFSADVVWMRVHYTALIQGTASITEEDDTVSSTGVITLKGTASPTEADDTLSATATISLSGTASITEGNDTSTATGTIALTGTASITEGADTLTATGAVLIVGTADITEADDTLEASGDYDDERDATASITEADDTVAASGALRISATASITEGDDTLAAELLYTLTGGMIWTQAETRHEDRRRKRLKKLLRETVQKVPEHQVRSPFPDPYRNGDPYQNLKRNRFPEPRRRKAKPVVVIDPIAEAEHLQALVHAEVVRQLEAEVMGLIAVEQAEIQRRRRQEEELLLAMW